MEPDRMQKRYRKRRSTSSAFSEQYLKRLKRAIPHIIYPEILVIVDYDGYRLHGGDNTQVSKSERCVQSISRFYALLSLLFGSYSAGVGYSMKADIVVIF